jgi:xanthine dehydrogenase accessory factor
VLNIAQELSRWLEVASEFAVATVAGVRGSAPRGLGAALAMDRDGNTIGSASSGCAEGAVHDLCACTPGQGGSVAERVGYSDEDSGRPSTD